MSEGWREAGVAGSWQAFHNFQRPEHNTYLPLTCSSPQGAGDRHAHSGRLRMQSYFVKPGAGYQEICKISSLNKPSFMSTDSHLFTQENLQFLNDNISVGSVTSRATPSVHMALERRARLCTMLKA
jgi:hypothetical protein